MTDGFFNLWDMPQPSGIKQQQFITDTRSDKDQSIEVSQDQPKGSQRETLLSHTWPDWFKGFRAHQEQAIDEIIDAFDRSNVVILDAPVGSGKTVIGEGVRVGLAARGLYVCSGLQLQDQFAGDFPYAKILKGRSNYPTESFPYPNYSAADCNKQPGDPKSCLFCSTVGNCAYEKAKSAALEAEIAVVNTTYLLYEGNSAGRLKGREIAILDECDLAERELMSYVEYRITGKRLDSLELDPPIKGAHSKTILAWIVDELIPELEVKAKETGANTSDVWSIREGKRWANLLTGARGLMKSLEENSDNWVREYESDTYSTPADTSTSSFIMKPVTVSQFGTNLLLPLASKWLLMSGTVISPEDLASSLGITDFEIVKCPMTFDVTTRPVVYAPVADMTYKKEFVEREKMLNGLEIICREHEGDNILVHTNSYKLNKFLYFELKKRLGNRIQSYGEAKFRDQALDKFKKNGGVLLAPSMDRGIDLPDDLCRVVVIAKIPYPSLADRQIATRMHLPGGQLWYNVQTVRTFIQMAGRGVRHAGDFSITYILDKQFGDLVGKNRRLIPEYFHEGLKHGLNEYRAVVKLLQQTQKGNG